MNDSELSEILRYSSPNTILIVTWNNLLKTLFCPFEVLVKHEIGELLKGERVWVDQVKVTVRIKTVFVIKGRAYYYDHFEILDLK